MHCFNIFDKIKSWITKLLIYGLKDISGNLFFNLIISVSTCISVIISLPMPNGLMQDFKLTESPVMEDPLQMSFPEIRTYNVKGIDDKYASGKLDLTEFGFHGMIRTPNGDIFIDPFCFKMLKCYSK